MGYSTYMGGDKHGVWETLDFDCKTNTIPLCIPTIQTFLVPRGVAKIGILRGRIELRQGYHFWTARQSQKRVPMRVHRAENLNGIHFLGYSRVAMRYPK